MEGEDPAGIREAAGSPRAPPEVRCFPLALGRGGRRVQALIFRAAWGRGRMLHPEGPGTVVCRVRKGPSRRLRCEMRLSARRVALTPPPFKWVVRSPASMQ